MKRKMKGKIGKVIKELCVFGVVIAIGTNIVGCGDDTKKESKKTTKTNMVTTSDSSEETTVNNENETITEEQEIDVSTDTATKESDSDTVAQQVATTKKEETTKKVETTTSKAQVTTTQKPVPTTTKKQETTTKKQAETTTKAPTVSKTWFNQKGYKITPVAEAVKAINAGETREEYICNIVMKEEKMTDWDIADGYKSIMGRFIYNKNNKSISYAAFDRNTGIALYESCSFGEMLMEVKLTIKGKETKVYMDGGASAFESGFWVYVPETVNSNDIVYMCWTDNNVKRKDGYVQGKKTYLLDEVYDFDAKNVFFLTVGDK